MEIIETTYLSDLADHRAGLAVHLARIDGPDDTRTLLQNILDTGYYDTEYFERQTGFQHDGLTVNLWFVTSMIKALAPRRTIEIGAGKGDVIEMLRRADVDAWGIDFSDDMYSQLSPLVRDAYHFGDALGVCRSLADDPTERFDTVVGLDIWEHLLPDAVADTVAATADLLTDDGFVISVIPAFGDDPVFGEVFPLEFEQNRARLDAGLPFDHLTLETIDPPIPTAGHLVWAPAEWWARQFSAAGLVRATEVEARLHAVFDPYLPDSNRSFFVYRRDTVAAADRADAVLRSLRLPASILRNADLARLARARRAGHTFAVSPLHYVADRNPRFAVVRCVGGVARRVVRRLLRR